MTTVAVACVTYRPDPGRTRRWAAAVARAAALAGPGTRVSLLVGDCSEPGQGPDLHRLSNDVAAGWGDPATMRVVSFGRNLHHSAGTNALVAAHGDDADVLWILNPDAVPGPRCLARLLHRHGSAPGDLIDARQLPLEHPQSFDPETGAQSWCSGASLLVPHWLWDDLGGFDAEVFPSYCNDVDLSWRARITGARALHAPDAVVMHDKRLDPAAGMRHVPGQREASVLGRLMLATRYGRPDLVAGTLRRRWWDPDVAAAAHAYRQWQERGRLPGPVPGGSTVAHFEGGEFERRRY